jgi:hypothetical protein
MAALAVNLTMLEPAATVSALGTARLDELELDRNTVLGAEGALERETVQVVEAAGARVVLSQNREEMVEEAAAGAVTVRVAVRVAPLREAVIVGD